MAKLVQHILLQKKVPIISTVLLASCVVTTVPMFLDEGNYLVLGVDNPQLRWWHIIVATFVHGPGFPGKVTHLAINGLFIAVFGVLVERCLGPGRLFVCSLASWTACRVSRQILTGSWRAHGISGATWGYSVLAAPILLWALRREGLQILKDPFAVLSALLTLIGAVGILVGHHSISMLVCAVCLGVWSRRLRQNLARIAVGQEPEGGPALLDGVSVAVTLAIAILDAAITVGVVGGIVR